ncbi:MAG: hypothetical protein ACOVOQ_03415 [Flavobacterium sp.]
MKTVIYIILSVFCISCRGQNIQHQANNKNTAEVISVDTVSVLSLRNGQYSNFKILRLYNLGNDGNRIDSTNRIELTKDNKTVASIILPNSEDVKNFSTSKIEETKDGFKIVVDWGGGNYFYGREFYFRFKGTQFYLDTIEMSNYIQEAEKEIRKINKISPPLPIDKFDIHNYLDNE